MFPNISTVEYFHYKYFNGGKITRYMVYLSLLDVGRFSHTLDHVGDHFVVPILDDFSKAWTRILACSSKAHVWREKTGHTMATYSETWWWKHCEVLHRVIASFLQEGDFSPASCGKILGILGDPQRKILLQIELAVVVVVGKQF